MKEDKISFLSWQEKEKLTLRKNNIFDKLLSKRISSSFKELQSKNVKYRIKIEEITTNPEIKVNPELYIKTQFDIKKYFPYIFSKNINQIKEALYLIDLFIHLQIEEIPVEKRLLSRNNFELINCLCKFLNFNDKQIEYYSCIILTNLGFFPYHIEKLIYTENNLKEIISFFNRNNFEYGREYIFFLINCNANPEARKYFVKNKLIERITFLINNNLDKLEAQNYIYLIKLIGLIIKVFYEDYAYSFEKIKSWFEPLLPFIKNTLENNYVKNPWAQNRDIKYYIDILQFYAKLGLKDDNLILNLIKDDFCNILIEFYYKINDDKGKVQLMEIFVDLTSKSDSINQVFIDEGLLGLLINEINRIEYKNNNLLSKILLVCSNLACGPLGQIMSLHIQGLLWKMIDICIYYSSQALDSLTKTIIYDAIFTLNLSIIGSDNTIRTNLIIYQEYDIINIYNFAINNIFFDEKKENKFLYKIGTAIYKLITAGESDLDTDAFDKFRNKMISVGMEELIISILTNNKDPNVENIYNFILEFIQEKNE